MTGRNPLAVLNRDQRLLFVSFVLWGLGMNSFYYIQPLYVSELGAAPEQIGLVLGISGLAVIALFIPGGVWADRHGRKPLMLAGWLVSIVAALGLAAAPDWRWLIPALVLFNLSNIAMPAANGYIAASIGPRAPAGQVFALLSIGAAAGSLFGPAVGGWIGEALGVRAVYVFAAVLFGLSTLLIVPLTPQPATGHPVPRTTPRRLLSHGPFRWQIAFSLLAFLVLDLGQVLLPKYLHDTRGLSLGVIGTLGSLGTLGIMLFQFALSRLPADRPVPLLISTGLALCALTLWLTQPGLAFIALGYFIHGSDRVPRPLLMGRLSRGLDADSMSLGYGFYETALRLGLTLSPLAAGWLYARSPAWPLQASWAGLIVIALLAFTLPAPALLSPGSRATPAGQAEAPVAAGQEAM